MNTGTDTGRRRRRRLRLTPLRSIPVEFTGERAGQGPLTLGQLNFYEWLSRTPDQVHAFLCAQLPVPTVVSVDEVAEAVAVLVARHEFHPVPPQPDRRLPAAGRVERRHRPGAAGRTGVFAPAGDQPLTAFLTATDAVHTPQQAHARCMTALAHHRTAITPHHYVFCDQTPGNPAHLESWRRLPIRVEGSGRA
jgi:hypothetical protein